MTKPASTPILAVISALPVILGCALLGATAAKAATCTADPNDCQPYVVTIDQEGNSVVATGSGEFDLTGLEEVGGLFSQVARITPNMATLVLTNITSTNGYFAISGPGNFGRGSNTNASDSSGPEVVIEQPFLDVPAGYTSGTLLTPSRAIFDDATFATLGITPGTTFRWTWGSGLPDQSFTVNVVPGPIVGAGLPGLTAALGGLVAMARRRRKQLA